MQPLRNKKNRKTTSNITDSTSPICHCPFLSLTRTLWAREDQMASPQYKASLYHGKEGGRGGGSREELQFKE